MCHFIGWDFEHWLNQWSYEWIWLGRDFYCSLTCFSACVQDCLCLHDDLLLITAWCVFRLHDCLLVGRVKAEPIKTFPEPAPNDTDVERSIKQMKSNDPSLKELNLNNIQVGWISQWNVCVLLLVWFCLLFAIFQQVSDLVTSTGFLSTTEYSSKSLHLPIRPWQPVSHLFSTISSNYTSHHELSVLQPSSYSKYHICPLILVGVPSATSLLPHRITFLSPSKSVPFCMFQVSLSPHSSAY